MRRRVGSVIQRPKPKIEEDSILSIKSKLIHSIICSYIPKFRLLKIASRSKRYQELCQITIEDYEVYHILKSNIRKKFSLSERPLDSALKTMRDIFELTKSELLYENHTEINVPTPIYALAQTKEGQIIASTENSLLVIEYDMKRNTFNIEKEIKVETNGAFLSLVEIGNNLLVASTFNKGIVINLETENIILELDGCCPIPLRDGRISYIIDESIIKIVKMDDIIDNEVKINIVKGAIPDGDTTMINKISSGIELRNGNLILVSWDKTITEYDIKKEQCIQVIQTQIEYMDSCYELKDGRLGITAMDNGNIYLISRLNQRNDDVLTLTGHNNTVIKILQLENEQIISASYDGKVKIWYKLMDGNFNCAMTLYLFNDYIRDFLFMNDGRILITGDEKTLRALGVKNHIGNFSIEFQPEDKRNKIIKSFQLIDNRIN